MKPLRFLFSFCAALLLTTAAAQTLAPIPPLKARVTDTVGMLKPNQRAALEKKLQEHESKTGNQVALLIVKNTEPEAIEQYGIRVAETWKLGRKSIDDGVILIVAKDTRKLRLEVGRGAEGIIPDAYAKRIVQDVIAPRFRQNDFYGGLNDGVTTIHTLLNKEAFPAPKKSAQSSRSDNPIGLFPLLFVLFPILIIIIGIIRARRFGRNDWHQPSSGIFIGGGGWGSGGNESWSSGSDFGGGGGDFGGGGASGDW
ncbi:MAG: YgcG family protein [Oxalobacter sp.]|nr:MAG: YgcG family protein [Oxalobacter sp.]